MRGDPEIPLKRPRLSTPEPADAGYGGKEIAMLHTVHDAPGFKLDIRVTHDPYAGPTVEFFSTWPRANHPEPHKLLSLTLPPESFAELAKVLQAQILEPSGDY